VAARGRRDFLPASIIRPKLGFVLPTVEWTQAVSAQYSPLVFDGALAKARVIDRHARVAAADVRSARLSMSVTLLEVWCRSVSIYSSEGFALGSTLSRAASPALSVVAPPSSLVRLVKNTVAFCEIRIS
jgi:hypothetical protein